MKLAREIQTGQSQGISAMSNLTQHQYTLLCEASNRALSDFNSSLVTVAIPSLHVIREHPVFLSKYSHLFSKKGLSFFQTLSIELRTWVSHLKNLLTSLLCHKVDHFSNFPLPKSVDILFVTHLINTEHSSISNDFYFANIPSDLKKMGFSVAIVSVNMTPSSSEILAKNLPSDNICRIILNKYMTLSDELGFLDQCLVERGRLRILSEPWSQSFHNKLLQKASREATATGTIFALRIGKQVSTLLSLMSAKSMIIIHEGHSWERIVLARARESNRLIKRIAYQHALLSRLQYAIFQTLPEIYLPDQIIASGIRSFVRFSHNFETFKTKIRLGGSSRSTTLFCSRSLPADRSVSRCLVIPEGIVEECNILFKFVFSCAALSAKTQFIIRLHPSLSHQRFDCFKNRNLRTYPNIMLSTRSLPEDLLECDYAIYRGSTAIVSAVCAGLTPIYLSIPNELPIDPLFEIQVGQLTVRTPEEFLSIIGSTWVTEATAHETTVNLCKGLYTPIDINEFVAALAE